MFVRAWFKWLTAWYLALFDFDEDEALERLYQCDPIFRPQEADS